MNGTADTGSAALTTTMVGLLVALLCALLLTAVTDLQVAQARARTAADAAALAAVSASPLVGGMGDPNREAQRLAQANGASVSAISRANWPFGVQVTVTLAPRLAVVRAVVDSVQATAAAAVRVKTP